MPKSLSEKLGSYCGSFSDGIKCEFRKRGYRVYSEPRAESQEIRLGVEWITDDLAKVELFIPVLCSWTARVTYAYGHWLVESTGGYDF